MSQSQQIERRFFKSEMRMDSEGRIEGYAAVFNEWSDDLGGFREMIRNGAFTKTISEADIRGLFNHDSNFVIGRNRSGTLELSEDDSGLHFRASPPETTWANDLKISIDRGDINQGSFGFWTVRDDWRKAEEGNERELIEVGLFDVSVVTFPAYPQTAVNVRSLMTQFISQARAQDADPNLIEELINELRAILPSAPIQEDHPGETDDIEKAQERLMQMRRRLRLAETI